MSKVFGIDIKSDLTQEETDTVLEMLECQIIQKGYKEIKRWETYNNGVRSIHAQCEPSGKGKMSYLEALQIVKDKQ